MPHWLIALDAAYLLTGGVHYLKSMRLAWMVGGPVGEVLRAGFLRPSLRTFVGWMVCWPVTCFRNIRRRARGAEPCLPVGYDLVEPVTFVGALVCMLVS